MLAINISSTCQTLFVGTELPLDRHRCFKSGNIQKTAGGQILPHLCNSLMISIELIDTKRGFVGARVFYMELTPNHSFRT